MDKEFWKEVFNSLSTGLKSYQFLLTVLIILVLLALGVSAGILGLDKKIATDDIPWLIIVIIIVAVTLIVKFCIEQRNMKKEKERQNDRVEELFETISNLDIQPVIILKPTTTTPTNLTSTKSGNPHARALVHLGILEHVKFQAGKDYYMLSRELRTLFNDKNLYSKYVKLVVDACGN